MKIVYSTQTGDILGVYTAEDFFKWFIPPNIPYGILEFNMETPTNQALYRDIAKTLFRTNSEGRPKYYVDTSTLEVYQTFGWVEDVETINA